MTLKKGDGAGNWKRKH